MFAAATRPRIAHGRAGVRVRCNGVVGRCAGRLVLRDRRGRLGAKSLSVRVHRARTVRVRLRHRTGRRMTARVITFQPGGYVVASYRYTLRR
jgi:hypothetical protein